MITFKENVKFVKLTPALVWMLYALEEFHREYTGIQPDTIVITSVNDSRHLPNSRHYQDEALDIRSKNFPTLDSKRVFRKTFESFLNKHPLLDSYTPIRTNKFRVILESEMSDNEHFHAQVKKGASFP